MKYSRYRHLNLLNCKVISKSKLYSYYITVSKTVYLSYNVYRNDPSVLRGVLDKKKRFNVKERKTTLLLRNITFKLLRFKDQQKGLARQADELFNYKFNIIVKEEREA